MARRAGKSIVTKKGDAGTTTLYSGERVRKDDPRLEVVGAIDELSAFLGMARSVTQDKKGARILERIQKDLSMIATEISAGPAKRLKKQAGSSHIKYLEGKIKKCEEETTVRNFVLPGYNITSSTLHVARTITRRLERRAVSLAAKDKPKNKHIFLYLNRLSDLLFLLACLHEPRPERY